MSATNEATLPAEDRLLTITRSEPVGVESAAGEAQSISTIMTRLTFDASAEEVWEVLAFYEQIDQPPPLLLRLLLPVPIRTEGKKSEAGDEAVCLYHGGSLLKRVTEVDRARRYEFEVTRQELVVGGGMKLAGGKYTLRELTPDRTEVELTTRFVSQKRPRWLWKWIEAAVCHLFHRHILRAMRRDAEARRAASPRSESP